MSTKKLRKLRWVELLCDSWYTVIVLLWTYEPVLRLVKHIAQFQLVCWGPQLGLKTMCCIIGVFKPNRHWDIETLSPPFSSSLSGAVLRKNIPCECIETTFWVLLSQVGQCWEFMGLLKAITCSNPDQICATTSSKLGGSNSNEKRKGSLT